MHDGSVWYFKEGYVRTSSEPFTLAKTSDEDLMVHLTNNAVQKNNKNYGKYEDGNIIGIPDLCTELCKGN